MDDKNTKQLDNANREERPTPPHGDKLWPEQDEQNSKDRAAPERGADESVRERGHQQI